MVSGTLVTSPPRGDAELRTPVWRRWAAWIAGLAGLIAYNWWAFVPLKPGLMTSPDEFYSNLEVAGRPYATLFQHCDIAAGILLVAAFALAGWRSLSGRREWLCLIVFAIAGSIGGMFPEACADGVNASCMSMERHFQLPLSQYVHDGAGVIEFTAITLALLLALWRTRRDGTRTAWIYRGLAAGAVLAYPLLGVAYSVSRLGGVAEAVFFAGFTVMVVTQLAERLRPGRYSETLSHLVADLH
jgi:uncharacterized protein DUF998